MIRDEEIKRLTQYANGIGVSVTFSEKFNQQTDAEWVFYNNNQIEIILYVNQHQSKTHLILNFLHELAHHLDHRYNNSKLDKDTSKVLITKNQLNKEERELVYLTEKAALVFRIPIAKETDLKIPLYRIIADIEYDDWYYYYYYLNGNFPTKKDYIAKYKEFKLKNKEKYGNIKVKNYDI